ncbi:MAG: sensor histidine kinase, partial [Nitrospinota bacterium]
QAHLELQRAYEGLEQAQRSAITAEKLAALGRLIAGVSHEILNPLNVITLTLYTMMDDPATPPEVHQCCGEMKEQADRIIKIAQNLLYVARQHPPERLPLDLNEMIERDLELMGNDLRLRNIAVEFNLSEKLPPVLADKDQFQQVVLNLLTNARDAMPRGGRLILNTEAIEADGHRFVGLRVEDTGEGIPPEHLDKLFDPFFTTKGEGKGTGLGLSICQGIIESHGGSIWAESVPGGGAAFIVRLSVEDD